MLVRIAVDMIIYHLSSRINSRQMPEIRIIRYEKAIEDLEKLQKAKGNTEIPVRAEPDEDDGNEFAGHRALYGRMNNFERNAY